MAHKKGVGSSDNGRDSISKRLGVKLFGGEVAKAGMIIIRQRGTRYHPGENVYLGKDHTVHAAVDGTVTFNRRKHNRVFVSITPTDAVAETAAPAKAAKQQKATPSGVAATESTVKAAKSEVKVGGNEKIKLPSGKKVSPNDLKVVEGIGPKIEELLHAAGIMTWADLAGTAVDKISGILQEAGSRYAIHNPSTWPKQAEMADNGEWEELDKYQDYLQGGIDPNA